MVKVAEGVCIAFVGGEFVNEEYEGLGERGADEGQEDHSAVGVVVNQALAENG